MTSVSASATLSVFIFSIFFVICPISIPTPRPIPRIPINLTTAPILAIVLLWAAQCIDTAVIHDGIVGTEGVRPYNIVILFFALAYMAITLDITGVLRATAFWVSNKGGYNGWKLYVYFYVMFALLTILLGNDPVILFGTAFLVYYTDILELDPTAWIMAEFAIVNTASMILFVGNPTNVVICEGFSINNATFTTYTILPFLACNLFCFIVLVLQYRKQVPRKLAFTVHRDPRSALLDSVGAWVGSIMLGIMLILCVVASFLEIDVWMISLPFAAGKFLFDLGWDHYRYSRGIPMLGRGLPGVTEENFQEPTVDKHRQTGDTSSSYSSSTGEEQSQLSVHDEAIANKSPSIPRITNSSINPHLLHLPHLQMETKMPNVIRRHRSIIFDLHDRLDKHFPTIITTLPRLPLALVPFLFSQFILIEALDHQGWVKVFANGLVWASHNQVHPTIWLVGVICVVLNNFLGTNICTTILLTKVVRMAALSYDANRGAGIALAVASNVGAVGFTFSASLTGLLWRAILGQKGIYVRQRDFALRNLLPLLVMTSAGFGIVSAEIAILSQR